MPFPADSAKRNFGRRIIFSFSLRKSQRLRQTEAHCSNSGLAQTAHTVPLHCSVQRAAVAGTLLWPRHHWSALHGPVTHRCWSSTRGWSASWVALSDWLRIRHKDQCQHSHQRQPHRVQLLERRNTDGKQGSLINTLELPKCTGTGSITSGARVKVWATWHSGNKRRRVAQWHNASSGATNTDGTQMKDFLSLFSGAQQTEITLSKFVCKQGQTPKPLTTSKQIY